MKKTIILNLMMMLVAITSVLAISCPDLSGGGTITLTEDCDLLGADTIDAPTTIDCAGYDINIDGTTQITSYSSDVSFQNCVWDDILLNGNSFTLNLYGNTLFSNNIFNNITMQNPSWEWKFIYNQNSSRLTFVDSSFTNIDVDNHGSGHNWFITVGACTVGESVNFTNIHFENFSGSIWYPMCGGTGSPSIFQDSEFINFACEDDRGSGPIANRADFINNYVRNVTNCEGVAHGSIITGNDVQSVDGMGCWYAFNWYESPPLMENNRVDRFMCGQYEWDTQSYTDASFIFAEGGGNVRNNVFSNSTRTTILYATGDTTFTGNIMQNIAQGDSQDWGNGLFYFDNGVMNVTGNTYDNISTDIRLWGLTASTSGMIRELNFTLGGLGALYSNLGTADIIIYEVSQPVQQVTGGGGGAPTFERVAESRAEPTTTSSPGLSDGQKQALAIGAIGVLGYLAYTKGLFMTRARARRRR